MRALLLIAVFFAAVPDREAPAPKEKAKPAQEQILGEWLLVKGVIGGMVPPKDIGGTMLIFTANELQVQEKGKRQDQEDSVYKLDATKTPVTIDIILKRGGDKKIEGILKIEGDQLTLCFAHSGAGSRPTEFASPPNTQIALMQFIRVKK